MPCGSCRDETCLRGFRQGLTQTRMDSHRRCLESLKFQIKEVEELYYLSSKNKGADQLGSTQVKSAFVFAYAKKQNFS